MIRVMLVDDHGLMREGLRALLSKEKDLKVVGEASDGHEALEAFPRLKPDVVLLDLQLPDQDGKNLIPRFLEQDPGARILVLSTFGTEADITRSLTLGARGYLMKSTRFSEVAKAVRRVASGELHISAEAAARIPAGLRLKPLTERELGILRLVAQGKANDAIAEDLHISPHTLKTHFTHILDKLDVKDRTQALVAAITRGLIRMP